MPCGEQIQCMSHRVALNIETAAVSGCGMHPYCIPEGASQYGRMVFTNCAHLPVLLCYLREGRWARRDPDWNSGCSVRCMSHRVALNIETAAGSGCGMLSQCIPEVTSRYGRKVAAICAHST